MREESLKLILIRHAETVANYNGEYLGFSDSPLTAKGEESAKALCRYLSQQRIEHIYASTSKRVYNTIYGLSNFKEKISLVKDLREINFGEYEGKDFNWIKDNNEEQIECMIAEGSGYTYPKGESLDMMHERVILWLDNFLSHHKHGTYLIATHAGVIRSILSHLLTGTNDIHWNFKIRPASITTINIQDGFPIVENLGHVPYNNSRSNLDIK